MIQYSIYIFMAVLMAFCVFGIICIIYAVKLGFKMGRQTIDKPVSEPKDQGTGQPVLADYDPYADAMGDDSFLETVTKREK